MIIISSDLVITQQDIVTPGDGNLPIIGYQNVGTSISADTEDLNFPAINMANPSTFLRWQGLPGGGGGAPFSDDFNRPNEILEDSPNWTRVGGTPGACTVSANALAMTATESAYLAQSPGSADHFVEVSWQDATTDNPGGFVCCRLTDANNFVGVRYRGPTASFIDMYKRVGGTFISLGSFAVTIVAGDIVKLECSGDTARLLINDVEVIAPASLGGDHAGVTGVGVVSRVTAQDPFIDDFNTNGLNPEQDHITIRLTTTDLIDYVGIARHNFGTAGISVSLEGNDGSEPIVWQQLTAPTIPPNDAPLLFRFTPASFSQLRVVLEPGSEAPTVAVVYAGKLLVFEHGIQGDYTPLVFARTHNVVTGRAEQGNFLGRIVTRASLESSANIQFLTPSFYRAQVDPFLAVQADIPFFWAWAPDDFPDEVAFGWLTNDPMPAFDENGFVGLQFDMVGIVE